MADEQRFAYATLRAPEGVMGARLEEYLVIATDGVDILSGEVEGDSKLE